MLQKRSGKVDGIQVRQIQKLVLPSHYFNHKDSLVKAYLSNLRKLVEEVVNFESEFRIIKVEI